MRGAAGSAGGLLFSWEPFDFGLRRANVELARAARKQAEMADMIIVYGPACERLGYAPQSDQWRSCIISLSTKDEVQRYGGYAGYGGPWHGRYWGGGYWGPGW